MKTQTNFLKLFAMILILIAGFMPQASKAAEPKFINVQLNVSLNGAHKKEGTYTVNVLNRNINKEKTITISNKTNLLLEYNAQYEITISCDGYNTKIVELDTDGPVDSWLIMADVDLSNKNKKVVHAGKIAYDKHSKTFKSMKRS